MLEMDITKQLLLLLVYSEENRHIVKYLQHCRSVFFKKTHTQTQHCILWYPDVHSPLTPVHCPTSTHKALSKSWQLNTYSWGSAPPASDAPASRGNSIRPRPARRPKLSLYFNSRFYVNSSNILHFLSFSLTASKKFSSKKAKPINLV